MNEKSDEESLDNSILQFARNRRVPELPDVKIAAEGDPGLAFTPPSQTAAYFATKTKKQLESDGASEKPRQRSTVQERMKDYAAGVESAHARLTLRLTEPLLSLVWTLSQQYREIPTKTVYRLIREALEARKLL
ncbi:hypothetical protein [Phyllobacterium zundukense]|uniref:Uncharacterized protein n=1 Tax=Phyllobacterium zundukense TaxID=1867719 RepID=A0A2N9W381_9HYPH|nr:hypothetical protein [Phyllobacterium zundukense]ATU94403.1 hypothetical protein BLM14_21960 [Phyllobacterium zundukense]PIO46199.1 hypothetical protein B5P45_03575 [Phyllobacterium zundukense]